MKGFLRALRAEGVKTALRTKYRVFLVLLLCVYVLSQLFHMKLLPHSGRGVAIGGFLLNVYLPLLAFLTANDLFACEIRMRCIQQAVFRPISRMGIFFAKFACVLWNCAAHLMIVCAIDTALAFSGNALGSPWQLVFALIDLVPLCTLCAFACFVSLAFASPAFSMLFCLAGYIFMHAAGAFTGASPVLFTSYLTWHTLFQGGMSLTSLAVRILMVASPAVFFLFSGALILEGKRF